jgi:acetyl-CoA acetyltransferase
MDYITRLDNYDGKEIAKIALRDEYQLYEEAVTIYKKFDHHLEGVEVLLTKLGDIDRVDLHEAFAAVVLCVQKALASDAFARERLGRDQAVGIIDEARLNVHGGSVALGHPFGATGARMVLTMARELHLSGAKTALLGICAAGGLGAAAVLERV